MKKSIKNISGIKLGEKFLFRFIALILSIALWLIVTYSLNPAFVKTINSVEITYENSEDFYKKYSIMNDIPKTVDVMIRGSRNDVIGFKKDQLRATVDLSDVTDETKQVEVKVKQLPSKFAVARISEPNIALEVDKNIVKKFQIKIHQIGETGGKTWVEFVPETKFVEVSGPQSEVEKIDEVAAIVDVADVKDGAKESYLLEVVSKNPELGVPEVSLNKVDIVIKTVLYTEKRVEVKPIFSGVPSGGVDLVKYTVKPEELTLSAPVKTLNKLAEISSKPIELSQYTGVKTVSVNLDFDDDILKMMGKDKKVSLEMVFDKKMEKVLEFNSENVSITGVSDGKKAVILRPKTLKFDLSGYSKVVENIKLEDVYVAIELPPNYDEEEELYYSYGIKESVNSEGVSIKKHRADTRIKLELVDE